MIIKCTKYGIIPVESLVGCLCWFWNSREEKAKIGILADYYEDEEYPEQNTFYELNGGSYKFCCPVEDYEVKLYADKDCKTASKRKAVREFAEAVEANMEEQISYYEDKYEGYGSYLEAALDDKVHITTLEDDEIVEKAKQILMEL